MTAGSGVNRVRLSKNSVSWKYLRCLIDRCNSCEKDRPIALWPAFESFTLVDRKPVISTGVEAPAAVPNDVEARVRISLR